MRAEKVPHAVDAQICAAEARRIFTMYRGIGEHNFGLAIGAVRNDALQVDDHHHLVGHLKMQIFEEKRNESIKFFMQQFAMSDVRLAS